MKIAVFIGSFGQGGPSARLLRYFFPYWTKKEMTNISLLLLQNEGELLSSVSEDVAVYSIGETRGMKLPSTVIRAGRILRKINPDVVISFMWYPTVISYLVRKTGLADFRHIAHETLNMSEFIREYFRDEKYIQLKRFLIRHAYRDSEKVIAVSEGVRKDLIQNFRILQEKIEVIYNPVNRELIARMASEASPDDTDEPCIVALGRLTYQKGFDILLEAFSKVRGIVKSRLVIIGGGDSKKELKALANRLDLDGKVIFHGFQKNPFQFMAGATVFCSSSRYEGFSNPILEAMALGLPVVAADCPSGPAEILGQGAYGVLVPPEDPDALAEGLIKVLSDTNYRSKLTALSLKRAQDFESGILMEKWDQCLKSFGVSRG